MREMLDKLKQENGSLKQDLHKKQVPLRGSVVSYVSVITSASSMRIKVPAALSERPVKLRINSAIRKSPKTSSRRLADY